MWGIFTFQKLDLLNSMCKFGCLNRYPLIEVLTSIDRIVVAYRHVHGNRVPKRSRSAQISGSMN